MKISDVSKIALFRHFQKKDAKELHLSNCCANALRQIFIEAFKRVK